MATCGRWYNLNRVYYTEALDLSPINGHGKDNKRKSELLDRMTTATRRNINRRTKSDQGRQGFSR